MANVFAGYTLARFTANKIIGDISKQWYEVRVTKQGHPYPRLSKPLKHYLSEIIMFTFHRWCQNLATSLSNIKAIHTNVPNGKIDEYSFSDLMPLGAISATFLTYFYISTELHANLYNMNIYFVPMLFPSPTVVCLFVCGQDYE